MLIVIGGILLALIALATLRTLGRLLLVLALLVAVGHLLGG